MQKVFVTKTELIRLLGPAAWKFAMFMASGSQEGAAVKIMFENVDDFDLTDSFIQQMLMPMLLQIGVFDQSDVDRVNQYIDQTLGL